MGWGIVYPPYSVINMGAIQPPTPTTRWVYNFNGVDSCIAANSQVYFGQKFTVSVNVGLLISTGFVFDGNQPRSFCYLDSGNRVFFQGVTLKIDGVEAISGVTVHTGFGLFEFTANQDLVIETIASRYTFSTFLSGYIYNLKIEDGSVYNYPINDRTFGPGAVIKNTGTGSDATGVNLLESGWTEINT